MFQTLVENLLNEKIIYFQSDGGGEFVSKVFLDHLASKGIKHLMSCPHTPQQNGVAERKHRHLIELALSMMFESNVPQQYWMEAFFTANFLGNLLPTVLSPKSPYELLFGKSPEYTSLRSFGCECYPCLRPYSENKFDPRSLKCVFIGYNDKFKGYRCLYPPTGRVYIARHVLFNEENFTFCGDYRRFHSSKTTTLLTAWNLGFNPSEENIIVPDFDVPIEELLATKPASLPALQTATNSPQIFQDVQKLYDANTNDLEEVQGLNADEEAVQVHSPEAQSQHTMQTRAKSGISKPNPRYALLTVKDDIPQVPKTIVTALKHNGWKAAMDEEIKSIQESHTWNLVPLQADMKLLGCRWVYTVKLTAEGKLDKLKARLVAKGFDQEEDIDYFETYSPVVKTATVRMVLHTATVHNWEIKQLDVKNAFLHGDLEEAVFMTQPPGYKNSEHPDHVCCLSKALYGLKQAPRAWFNKFSDYLLEFGFSCFISDPSLFVYKKGVDVILLLLYVDDMLVTGNNMGLVQSFVLQLSEHFRIKDMGKLHYFLGIQASFVPTGLFLNQQKYAEDLLQVAGMKDCSSVATPLPFQLNRLSFKDQVFSEPTYFRSLAGKLQYLTLTRPDIQYVVNYVCQKMHKPMVSDFHLLKRILNMSKAHSPWDYHSQKIPTQH